MIAIRHGFASLCVLAWLGGAAFAEDLYTAAATHFRSGEWEAAAHDFSELLGQSPAHPKSLAARNYYAESLLQLGRPAEAAEQYAQLCRGPSHAYAKQSWFRWGETATLSGDATVALAAFEHFTHEWPDDPLQEYVLLYRGRLALEAKQFAIAESLFAAQLVQYPTGIKANEAQLGVLKAQLAQDQWDSAEQTIQTLLTSQPTPEIRSEALAGRVTLLAQQHQWAAAQETVQELLSNEAAESIALEAASQLAERAFAAHEYGVAKQVFVELSKENHPAEWVRRGLSGLAWCQLSKQELNESAATFERLLQQAADDPLAAEATLARGYALEQLQQLDAALVMYHRLEQLPAQPHQLAQGLWRAARLHEQLAERERARELYLRVVKDFPHFASRAEVLAAATQFLLDDKDEVAAAEVIEQLATEFPAEAPTLQLMLRYASLTAAQHHFAAARAMLAKCDPWKLTLSQRSPLSLLAGQIAVLEQDWPAAQLRLDEILAAEEPLPEAFAAGFWRAEAQYQQGAFAKAIVHLEELRPQMAGRSEPWLPMIPLRYCQCLGQLNQWERAIDAAQQFAVDYHDFRLRYEALLIAGRGLSQRGEYAAARTAYQKIVSQPEAEQTEAAALAQWLIGETHFHQQAYRAAYEAYQLAAKCEGFPRWQAAALLQGGKCCERLGEFALAKQQYESLAQLFPESELVADARQRLGGTKLQ